MAQAAVNLPDLANSQRRAGLRQWLILSPLVLWLLIFVVAPNAILLIYSFGVPSEQGHGRPSLPFLSGDFSQTLSNYSRIFRPAFGPVLLEALLWGIGAVAVILGLRLISRLWPNVRPSVQTIFIGTACIFCLRAGLSIIHAHFVPLKFMPVLWVLWDGLQWGLPAGIILATWRWMAESQPRWKAVVRCMICGFILAAGISLHFGIPAVARLPDLSVSLLKCLWRSVEYAAFTTVICLLVGYPVAFFIGRCTPLWRNRLLMLIMIPFWTSFLIRTYAWITILRENGLLNSLLVQTGMIEKPLELFYSPFSVSIGLLYNFLPFMILPIYGSVEKLDNAMVEAAQDLGAGPIKTFFTVIFPLTWAGVAAGVMLVFVPAIGMYAIYELMGGGKIDSIGSVIERQFIGLGDNIPLGSALGMTVMVLFAAAYMLSVRRSPSQK